MVAALRCGIPIRTRSQTGMTRGGLSGYELRYNELDKTRARSSADRALASGARGQRFESSRAYRNKPHDSAVFSAFSVSVSVSDHTIGNIRGISGSPSVGPGRDSSHASVGHLVPLSRHGVPAARVPGRGCGHPTRPSRGADDSRLITEVGGIPDRSCRHHRPGRVPGTRRQEEDSTRNSTNAQVLAEVEAVDDALCGIPARMGALLDLSRASLHRSRALPVAITTLETGTFWLEEAIREVTVPD
jgi:hypothetical protein